MLIADLPPIERPRERLSALGPGALADRELLALVLGTGGSPGLGAHHLAERLLARFSSMAALSRAHPADLVGETGVGTAKAAALAAAFELGRRVARSPASTAIASTADLVPVVAPLLRGHTRERLVLVVCDNANRVTSCEVISEGSAERAVVPVREIAVAVLRRDGTAFGLAHNHPSGDMTPSAADVKATVRVAEVSRTLGLRFLDHVVLTNYGWCRVPRRQHTGSGGRSRASCRLSLPVADGAHHRERLPTGRSPHRAAPEVGAQPPVRAAG